MYTHTIKITELTKRNSLGSKDNVVLHCRWRLTTTEEESGNSVWFDGATPLPVSENTVDGFVKYEDLTEEIVVSWIEREAINLDRLKKDNQRRIEESKVEKEILDETSLPWN